MANLMIRQVPQDVHDYLTQRAEAEGRSMAEVTRRILRTEMERDQRRKPGQDRTA